MPIIGITSALNIAGVPIFGIIKAPGSTAGIIIDECSADRENNIIITGRDQVGVGTAYVAKINGKTGALIWDRAGTDGIYMDCYRHATDSNNRIISGGFANSQAHTFVLDKDGTLAWHRKFNKYATNDIAVDSTDNIYLMVQGNGATPDTSNDMMPTKYSSTGSLAWQRRFYSNGNDNSSGVVVNSAGDPIFSGSRDLRDGVLVKYNSSGTLQWQTLLLTANTSGSYGQSFNRLGIDSSDNLYLSSWNFHTGYDTTFVKYNSSGTLQWQRKIAAGGTKYFQARTTTADTNGNSYHAGYFNPTTGGGAKTLVVVKYDTSGTLQWARKMEVSTSFTSTASIDAFHINWKNGMLLIGGIYFETDTITQGLWAKLPDDGTRTGSYTVDGKTFTYSTYTGYTESAQTLSTTSGNMTDAATFLTESAFAVSSFTSVNRTVSARNM